MDNGDPQDGPELSNRMNMLDVFTNVSRCADKLRLYGPFGAPTILVSAMIIAGEDAGADLNIRFGKNRNFVHALI